MYYFCTYFDHHYLPRGLALYRSLRDHCSSFQLWVLCMNRTCYDVLSQLGLPDVRVIALEDFERGDQELLKARQNRTLVEYYFTCTSSLPMFILNNHSEVDIITYLDADLFFFDDPATIYAEIADNSIAIIGHRFPPNLHHLERLGIYNVGWLSFRRDKHSFACLSWWRERCIEWCYDRYEDGRYADQKYLDDWPGRFQDVVVLCHKGANLAPWNLANYKIHRKAQCVFVDEQPLIFFHFQGFKQVRGWLYNSNSTNYNLKLSRVVRRDIYAPYIQTLLDITGQVSPLLPKVSLRGGVRSQTMKRLRDLLQTCRGIFTWQYILIVNGHVI